ncbi:MAG: hypothetical protein RLZZ479_461, partial [Bacteroidota bacterium]
SSYEPEGNPVDGVGTQRPKKITGNF